MIADENHLCLDLRLYDGHFEKKVRVGMYENMPVSELSRAEGGEFQLVRELRKACNELAKQLQLELQTAAEGRNDEQPHPGSD